MGRTREATILIATTTNGSAGTEGNKGRWKMSGRRASLAINAFVTHSSESASTLRRQGVVGGARSWRPMYGDGDGIA